MERTQLARLLGAAQISQVNDLAYREATQAGGDVVIVEERAPKRWREAFVEAVASGGTVFLANPQWSETERAQFKLLTQSEIQNQKSKIASGWLCIPTGGSSGQLKLARHDQDTLHAAVRGFARHFSVERVNAVGVLPLHHVGGLMGWLRCVMTGGVYLDLDWKALEAGGMPVRPERPDGWFLSLVPTQLQRLLAQPAAVAWLRGFRAVLVGGGPLWPELADQAARAGVPLAPTFGSTETAAAVAALRPGEFLAGRRGCGSALPHARITVQVGDALLVEGESLFRGYWPHLREPGSWVTDDRGRVDESGSLHVLGRNDALIVTGGEKVDPAEVEAVLRATGEFDDVAVVGIPDSDWGHRVVACYPAGAKEPDQVRVTAALEQIAAFKRPKRLVALAAWPRSTAGKIDRSQLVRMAGDR